MSMFLLMLQIKHKPQNVFFFLKARVYQPLINQHHTHLIKHSTSQIQYVLLFIDRSLARLTHTIKHTSASNFENNDKMIPEYKKNNLIYDRQSSLPKL